jgi:succinoglycan biosynthesis protein ExoA
MSPTDAARARRRVSGNLSWNLWADLAARGASLWMSFVCARLLGVESFGRFSFALAVAQYAWLAGDVALNAGYATRETARARGAEPDQARLFWSARLLAATLLTAAFLAAIALAPGEPATRRALAGAATFFLAYAAFPDWALRGAEDFRGLALGNLAYAGGLVATTLIVLPAHRDPALATALWGGGFALAALVTLPRLARRGVLVPRPRLSLAAWRGHARRSALFALGSFAAIGSTQLPILLAGSLTTPREVGLFSAGFRLLIAFVGVLGILWWPLMPVLTREKPRSSAFREVLGASAALVLAVSVPVALALTLFPVAVLGLLFGPGYEAGALPLALGAWALPLYALTGLLEQVTLAIGRERLRARLAWTTLAGSVVLALALIPRLGATGAALVSLGGFALALALYALRLRGEIALGDLFRPLGRVVPAGAALAALWLAGPRLWPAPPLAWIALGAALYGALAWRLGLLRLAPGLDALRGLLARLVPAPGARPVGGAPRAALAREPLPACPFVSVVLAVRDEERHVERALAAVQAQEWPSRRMEILVVDGESGDATPALVARAAERDPRVVLLHNPGRRVAPGLNVGLRAARGAVIVRVDGHCEIPPGYVARCVEMLRAGADCAGGPVRAEGNTPVARAVALAMSTPWGVGGASFRWAAEERDVDHLPFGAWRASLFEAIGPFDETLVRNQDDELSDRLRRHGGRIRLDPAIASRYFSRATLGGLWRQYLGYGFWKVRVIRKRGGWPSSPRHLAPATFVGATALALGLALATGWWLPVACVLGPYLAFLAAAGAHLGLARRDRVAWLVPAALATMHVAYGVGFLAALGRAVARPEPVAPARPAADEPVQKAA